MTDYTHYIDIDGCQKCKFMNSIIRTNELKATNNIHEVYYRRLLHHYEHAQFHGEFLYAITAIYTVRRVDK